MRASVEKCATTRKREAIGWAEKHRRAQPREMDSHLLVRIPKPIVAVLVAGMLVGRWVAERARLLGWMPALWAVPDTLSRKTGALAGEVGQNASTHRLRTREGGRISPSAAGFGHGEPPVGAGGRTREGGRMSPSAAGFGHGGPPAGAKEVGVGVLSDSKLVVTCGVCGVCVDKLAPEIGLCLLHHTRPGRVVRISERGQEISQQRRFLRQGQPACLTWLPPTLSLLLLRLLRTHTRTQTRTHTREHTQPFIPTLSRWR